MQKVIIQIDWYVKIILTLIAVLLAGLSTKPYITFKMAKAEDFINGLAEGFEQGTTRNKELYQALLEGDEYSKRVAANRGEYNIIPTGKVEFMYILEKHTGRLSLLTTTNSFGFKVINNGYIDEILEWESD